MSWGGSVIESEWLQDGWPGFYSRQGQRLFPSSPNCPPTPTAKI